MKAARQRAALAVYERRQLGAALRQWRWVQRSKSLLRRVFGTAVELWQEEVRGLLGHCVLVCIFRSIAEPCCAVGSSGSCS